MSKLNVCVDLSLVHFVDMGALRTLERLHQQCRSEGRELRLINLRDPIRLTVDITGFRTRLPVEQPLEQPIEQPLEITSADAQFEALIQELLLTDPKQLLKSV